MIIRTHATSNRAIRLREALSANQVMAKRLAEIEKSVLSHDAALRDLYQKTRPARSKTAILIVRTYLNEIEHTRRVWAPDSKWMQKLSLNFRHADNRAVRSEMDHVS